jgi:CRP-like cAMP-binding protein
VSKIDWLSAAVRGAAKERTLKAGETLFRAGARTAGLYEVTRGNIRLVRVNRVGRETIVCTEKSDSAILVMKTAEDRLRCDDAEALNRARGWGIFAQRSMNSRLVVISGVGF